MASITFQHRLQTAPNVFTTFTWLKSFVQWSEGQEPNRLLWTGIALTTQASILLPATMLILLVSGVNFFVLLLPIAAIVSALLVNLAALPAKITLPVYFLGLVTDLAVIACVLVSML